jgi:hypothetical protein
VVVTVVQVRHVAVGVATLEIVVVPRDEIGT